MVDSVFVKHASQIIQRLENSRQSSESDHVTVNLHQCFTNLTMDVIGDAAFGTEFNSQSNPDNITSRTIKVWLESFQKLGPLLFLPYWHLYPIKQIQDFFTGQNLLAKILDQVLDSRSKDPSLARGDLLQSLVELDGKEVKREDIIGEAFLFLIAGHETTSSTLTWASYVLTKHPDIEEKIVAEINEQLDGELPSTENIHKLHYLDCVINEVLRVYPPVLMTSRASSHDVSFRGKLYPKETMFVLPIWAMHHDPRYWNDPEKFDPDRWLPENKSKHVPGSYLPFGLGPRMCIGFKFSLVETKVVLAMLYKNYTFKYTQPEEPKIFGGNLYRPDGLLLDVYPREK